MARQLTLARTEAEWLVDLLEDCDPKLEGTWRHIMAAEVRELFGMCSLEEERRRLASEPGGEPAITMSIPQTFEQGDGMIPVNWDRVWACGHEGFPSVHPDPNGAVECTICANRRRFS